MARQVERLSARQVMNAKPKPGKRACLLADGGNLLLQCTRGADGTISRSWLFKFELDGRRREMGIGATHTVGLAEARERAKTLRQQLLAGVDPIEARLAERDKQRNERFTFKEAAKEFLALYEPTWRNEKHRHQWRNTLETYAYPMLGARPVKAIEAPVINEVVAPIWAKTPETASRVKQRIERLVQWVKDGKPLPTPDASKRKKSHPALPYDQMSDFMAELRGLDSLSARALEFTILTAARTNEVIGATWAEVKDNIWTIPAVRMKADKEHRVPLCERAVQILAALRGRKGRIFALSNMALLQLVRGMNERRAKAGQPRWTDPKQGDKDIVPHGFRSTFRDWAAETRSYPNHVVEMSLAHKIASETERSYRRGDLFDKRRRLIGEWDKYCAKPLLVGATVTPLRAHA